MNVRRFVPKSKLGRYVVLPIAAFLALVIAGYLFLLGAQAYSAVQASITLDRLEGLRIGSPQADFERAVRSCKVERGEPDYTVYYLDSGSYRFDTLWTLIWKLPPNWAYKLKDVLNHAGLRPWQVRVVSPSFRDGRLEGVAVGANVDGRYEALGTVWQLTERIEPRFKGDDIAEGNPPTYMHWFSITSDVSGEGFRFYLTPRSDEQELQARRINRKCFMSFRGCDGFCELLPDATRLLQERHRTFGGCSSVPRSWCELSYDDCRKSLQEMQQQTTAR